MARTTLVRLRCTEEQKQRYFEAAGGERQFSEWARNLLSAGTIRDEELVSLRNQVDDAFRVLELQAKIAKIDRQRVKAA